MRTSAGAARTEGAVDLFLSEIGPFLVAVDARVVRRVSDEREAATAPVVDLAPRLGDERARGGQWPRRVLHLETTRGEVAVMAGEELWTAAIGSDLLQEAPAFLRARLRLAGIGRVFMRDEHRFGYVLDPEAFE